MDGGYYRADLSKTLTVLSVNTLEYNKDQIQSEIGPEAQHQWVWLESALNDSGRKFLVLSHIYAGVRITHDDKKTASTLWMKD